MCNMLYCLSHMLYCLSHRWEYRGVMYCTINQIGSCNNLCKDQPDPTEWAARNGANIK